jgi:hypothetical protein
MVVGSVFSHREGVLLVGVLFLWWFLGLGLFLGFSGCFRLGVLAGFGVFGWFLGVLCFGF